MLIGFSGFHWRAIPSPSRRHRAMAGACGFAARRTSLCEVCRLAGDLDQVDKLRQLLVRGARRLDHALGMGNVDTELALKRLVVALDIDAEAADAEHLEAALLQQVRSSLHLGLVGPSALRIGFRPDADCRDCHWRLLAVRDLGNPQPIWGRKARQSMPF